MKVVVTRQFERDVEKELNKALQFTLADIVEHLKKVSSLKEIPNLKKMKGFKTAYRIRMGEYRIGFILQSDTITLSRIMNRKEIYRYFP